ncbi:MAG: methyltransferase [Bacteroidetes bacterium]|nr:methyltransferase [Bacteroidota bacterium]
MFSFKQFTIQQHRCAMKVCTDACLFAAWAADYLKKEKLNPKNILDIGAGTGLLSLILAQKTTAQIEAVEIDENAFIQANENFIASPWKQRLSVFHTDALEFTPEKKYDFIITNPPFFEDDLPSPHQNKNAAKHSSTLTFAGLLKIISTHLLPESFAAVLIPYHRLQHFEKLAMAQQLFISHKTLVKQSPLHSPFRAMVILKTADQKINETEITIQHTDRNYTPEFINLLKDYYLKL